MPDGGVEDYSWSVDSKFLAYVSVKKMGKDYAVSTNSDIYLYDNTTGKTINVSEGMMGYDKNPVFSPDGRYLAWTSMARDGYEADKNDIIILDLKSKSNKSLRTIGMKQLPNFYGPKILSLFMHPYPIGAQCSYSL